MKPFKFSRLILLVFLFIFSEIIFANEWQIISNMPTPRFNLSAEVVNNKLYAIGGVRHSPTNATISYSQVEEYDPISNKWSEKSPMPTARFSFATAVLDEEIYTFGGNKPNAPFSSVEVFNPKLNKWASKKEMKTPRNAASAASYNGKIYVFGGGVIGENETNITEAYNPKSDSWVSLKEMPQPRSSHVSVLVNDKIYLIGGKSKGNEYSQGFVTDVDEYDPKTNLWSKKLSIPTPRFQFSAVTYKNKIYVISGRDSKGLTTSVEVFDPQTNKWSNAKPLTEAVSGAATVVIGSSVYLIGGRTCVPECTTDKLLKYNLD